MFLILPGSLRIVRGLRLLSSHTAMRAARSKVVDAPSVCTTPRESEWTPSTILRSVWNSTGLRCIDVEVEQHIAAQYQQPGQYVKVQGADRSVLLAIASPPHQRNVLSFLVKDTPHHRFLLDLQTGASIDISIPLGKGFQIQEALLAQKEEVCPVDHIVLMACGSGLAPIAAVIESGHLFANRGLFSQTPCETRLNILPSRTVTLYVGARTRAHLPFAERYADWEKKGVRVRHILDTFLSIRSSS